MMKITLLLILFFSLILFAGTVVAEAKAEVVNFEVKPQNPVKGEVVTIDGQAQPDDNVTIKVSFEKVVPVEDKKYSFFMPKLNIPETVNRFTIRAEGCEDLKVSIKDHAERYPHWVTFSSEASGDVAEVSVADIPAVIYDILIQGKYDIRIHGKSLEESVRLTITADLGYEKADEKGNFRHTYDTSSVPLGEFIVQAGNKTETVHLRLPTLPTAPVRIDRKEIQSSGVIELLQVLLVMAAFVVPLVILAWKKRK